MRAWAPQRPDRPAKTRKRHRTKITRTSPPPPPPSPPPSPKLHFEAGWTDSWSHRRCLHEHNTLLDAAKCAMPRGCGWYVFAIEDDQPRELTEREEQIVNDFRFGKT